VLLRASTERELDQVFANLDRKEIDALAPAGDGLFDSWRSQIVRFAAERGLPAVYPNREFAADGGLMSYGSSIADAYLQAGIYAGRIVKGERPADLPVIQASKVELVLNLRAAKALGLTFPLTLLGRADEVIE
jgi:putative ABC transport system substrate-binding protein